MSLPNDIVANINLSDSTEKIIAEIGGSGMDTRSKARTSPGPVTAPAKLPKWNYNGSSTDQTPGDDSEVIPYPQAIFKDPFRKGNNILAMCDDDTPAGELIHTNRRFIAPKIISRPEVAAKEPWCGIEQEYTPLQKDVKWPMGWPASGFPGPQRPYCWSVGAEQASGRDIVNSHCKNRLYAGINISGLNGKDKLGEGDWNGAGARTNYSTKAMKKEGGMEVFNKAIKKLGFLHREPAAAFGDGNEKKPTGGYGTADISLGVADSGASVRVGCDIEGEGKHAPFLFFFISGVCSKKIVQTRAGRMAGMMAQVAKAWRNSRRN